MRSSVAHPAQRGGEAGSPFYRLLSLLSPGFPVGAFAYSHGLENSVEGGTVHDEASLRRWIGALVAKGDGRIDADILRCAHIATAAEDAAALDAASRRGLAFRATAELLRETTAQGSAFLATCRTVWPDALLDAWAEKSQAVCYPAAVGAVAARAGIPLAEALVGYLWSMAANLVSAGLRLGILGQTGGQRVLAALEPLVIAAATAALARNPADFGAASFAVDLAAMAHETQYTRLFRS